MLNAVDYFTLLFYSVSGTIHAGINIITESKFYNVVFGLPKGRVLDSNLGSKTQAGSKWSLWDSGYYPSWTLIVLCLFPDTLGPSITLPGTLIPGVRLHFGLWRGFGTAILISLDQSPVTLAGIQTSCLSLLLTFRTCNT